MTSLPRRVFHSRKYSSFSGELVPLVTVAINQGPKTVSIEALADTGCNVGLSFTKEQVKLCKLNLGKKINSDPLPTQIADGSCVATDVYKCVIELGGERKLVQVSVIDPDTKLQIKDEKEKDSDPDPERLRKIALMGRDFMNHFDSTFSGLDKEFTLSK